METVIPPDKTRGHVIRKYHFKVLTEGMEERKIRELEDEKSIRKVSVTSRDEMRVDEKVVFECDAVVKRMLKKVDELSGNLVKMQMRLEKQQKEFERCLKEERERAFEEGEKAGRDACLREMKQQTEELRTRLTATIETLEASRQKFMRRVDTIEEELMETALDLAKQVVAKEIRNDSKEIALRLARLLLAKVKDAAKITLKVNPDDYGYIKKYLEASRSIEIVPDSAVGMGGVIILSDIGNIDGEIMHRFERIKEAVFGTVKQGETIL